MTQVLPEAQQPPPTVRADYQVLPPLQPEEYAALKEDIRLSGRVRDPIIKNASGSILDGHHRSLIWAELRAEGLELPEPPVLIRQDLTDDDAAACRAAARAYNSQRRHLDNAAKRALVADQLRETPDHADPWIAEDLGVGRTMVRNVRTELERNCVIDRFDRVQTRDGRSRAATWYSHDAAIERLLRIAPETPDLAISLQAKCDHASVSRVRQQLERHGEIPVVSHRMGSDGKRHVANAPQLHAAIEAALRDAPESFDTAIAEQLDCSHRTVSRVRKRLEQAGQIVVVDRQVRQASSIRLVDPTDIPIVEQDTTDLRREHARLRNRARSIDAELRKRPRDHQREPRPGWVSPGTAQLTPASIVLEVADATDLREHVADGAIDLIVTSPPWNLDVGYHGATDAHRYDSLFAADGQISRYARELYRIADSQGRLCLNVPLQSWIDGAPRAVAHDWLNHLLRAGWQYRSTILWLKSGAGVKTSGVPVVGDGTPQQPIVGTPATDVVLVVHKGDWKLRRTGEHNLGTDDWPAITNGVWTFPAAHRERDADGIALHPAPFPEELVRRCLVLFSYQHAVIADPFIGSGTTAMVAARLGRRCYGFDISAAYIAQARARLEASIEEGS